LRIERFLEVTKGFKREKLNRFSGHQKELREEFFQ